MKYSKTLIIMIILGRKLDFFKQIINKIVHRVFFKQQTNNKSYIYKVLFFDKSLIQF